MLSATFSHFGPPGMLTSVQVPDRSPGPDEARVRDGSSALIPLRLDLLAAGDILETPRPGFELGDCRPPSIAGIFPLADLATAYQVVADGQSMRFRSFRSPADFALFAHDVSGERRNRTITFP